MIVVTGKAHTAGCCESYTPDLIANLEGQVWCVLDDCGLPGILQDIAGCAHPSSEQVRRPIFRDGMDQWRPFEPYLADLFAELGPIRTDWRE